MNVERSSVDLYWLPLGAGGNSVRLNGRGWGGGIPATSTTLRLWCDCRRGGS
jgi:hypothetical protein